MIIVRSQTVLFSEGFEAVYPANGWLAQPSAPNSNSWFKICNTSNTGSCSAECRLNSENGNSWLFTKAINLTAGKKYELNYYAKTETFARFKVSIGNAQNSQSQVKILRSSFTASSSFSLYRDTIVCEQTGVYYIGFNNSTGLITYTNGSVIDDVSVNEINQLDCSSVTAGAVTSNVAAVCAGGSLILTNANATTNSIGIRYSWQKSNDGINWLNITNGFTYMPTLTVSQTVPTWYRLTDTCVLNGVTAISNELFVDNAPYLTCYCTPTTISCPGTSIFTNVTIPGSAINNTTACSANGYGNYTAVGSAAAFKGQNVYINHTVSLPYAATYHVGVWADFNHNGIFEANEFSLNGPFTATAAASQILVPSNALSGETNLRLRVTLVSNPGNFGSSACSYNVGETEDYRINISDAADCSGAVNAGTISSTAQTCPNTNFFITAANTTINQAQVKYAWQQSDDNVTWTNISNTNYLTNPFTVSQNNSTYYRLTDTCLVTGQTSVSNVISVAASSIFNCYCVPPTSFCSTHSIDSVSFKTINNASGCSANGYGNYTSSISTNVDNGTNAPLYIKLKPALGVVQYVAVWIDYNRNGVFEEQERVYNGATTTTTNILSGNINIPYNIKPGETIMRIRVSPYTISNACISITSGETEDYKVILNVVNPLTQKFCYYVKQNATGLNDGTSWANAFTSVASAFSILQKSDTIKIAKGIYTAGSTVSSSLQLKDSVIILGGYPNTGNPADTDRDFVNNESIISGEIGLVNSLTDNVRLILSANGVKGFTVDGIKIEKGYSSLSNGFGPVYFTGASGVLKNVIIFNNYSLDGAALNIFDTKLAITNSFIENNSGIPIGNGYSTVNISTKSDVTFSNTVFAKNKSFLLLNQNYSTVKMLNSTVFKNHGYSIIKDTSNLVIQNSIFYNNGINFNDDSTEFKTDSYSSLTLNNTITEVYGAATANFTGLAPKFIDTAKTAGADNKYFTADDGLRLINPCSPGINTGNNSFVTLLPTDIAGGDRIKNGIVDLGAYEVQETLSAVPQVLYVNSAATGLNNGTSWQNAFTSLRSAFRACSDTIKVAMGNYSVSSTDVYASYRLENNRVFLGGYPNTGSPTNSDINTTLYPTVIDGRTSSFPKCYTVISSVNNDSTCRFIGFEITNSGNTPFYSNNFGTIRVAHKSSPYFENVKINSYNNEANLLINIADESKPKFYKCVFYNQFYRQNSSDGGRYISASKNSNPTFIGCYIGKDTTNPLPANELGANIAFTNSNGLIDSCNFYKASADAVAAEFSNVTIKNSVFTKTNGRNILSYRSAFSVENSVFNDTLYANTYAYINGGSISIFENSNAVFNRCRFNNSYSYDEGGACANEFSNTTFTNCIFKNCHSYKTAGTLYNKGGQIKLINCASYATIPPAPPAAGDYDHKCFLYGSDQSSNTIINSTFLSTTKSLFHVIGMGPSDTLKFYNSIIWKYGFGPISTNMGNDLGVSAAGTAVYDIRNSILFKQQNTNTVNTTIGINPRLTDLRNLDGADLVPFSADDGLSLCTASHAVNAGDNSLNPLSTDITGTSRIFNGTIDIGAYELQQAKTTNKTFYVKQNAPAGGNGTSWATAYNSFQTAVQNNNADTILVAQGTYKPATTFRDSAFHIYRNLLVYGGYPNTGNPDFNDRNVNSYPSILSGDIGTVNDSTDNSYSVVKINCPDSTVLLDGLIIERGNGNVSSGGGPGYSIGAGGGIYAYANKSLKIDNCIFRHNYANTGGGFYSFWSNFDISKTVFSNNNALTNSGGISATALYTLVNGLPWSVKGNFRNCVFSFNKSGAGTLDGAVGLVQDVFKIENCVVYKNQGNPAGFLLTGGTKAKFINCLFAKNNNLFYTPGIAITVQSVSAGSGLNAYVHNCIFLNNTTVGQVSVTENSDFNWGYGGIQQAPIPADNLTYSAFPTAQTGYNHPGNIFNFGVLLKNIENGAGNDNIWMTPDDGLIPDSTSASIDIGANSYVANIPFDILDSVRIKNVLVDMGPYEAATGALKPLCAPVGSTTIAASTTSASYQWQMDSGNGIFSNITNGANFSGSNAFTLNVTNVPSSWYGRKFRCMLAGGIADRVITLRFVNYWTGAVSSAWELPANWSCGTVPDMFTDVILNAGTSVINSNVVIRSLTVKPAVSITVNTGNSLTILH